MQLPLQVNSYHCPILLRLRDTAENGLPSLIPCKIRNVPLGQYCQCWGYEKRKLWANYNRINSLTQPRMTADHDISPIQTTDVLLCWCCLYRQHQHNNTALCTCNRAVIRRPSLTTETRRITVVDDRSLCQPSSGRPQMLSRRPVIQEAFWRYYGLYITKQGK